MKPLLSLILGCALVTLARAEEPTEHQKLADQVVDEIISAPLNEATFRKKASERFEQMIAQLQLDEKSATTVREIMLESIKALNTESITRTYRDAYAERFSTEELRGILAFYQTKAGKALLAQGKELEKQIQMRQTDLVTTMVQHCTEQMKQRAPDVMKKIQEQAK